MDLLLVSNIALWIGFIAMVVINLALARQIGVLYERVAPAGALMMNQTLTVGKDAPRYPSLLYLRQDIQQAIGK